MSKPNQSKAPVVWGKLPLKNIKERRELDKKLGIDKLADELRKTSKDYDQNLDLVYSSDE